MDRSAKFWDRIAERYARRPVSDEAAYQKKLRITRDHFRPDMRVLEFGCGTGSTAIAHAPYVGHIHAIDISANMLAIARRKATAAGVTNVTFEQATIEAFSAPEQSLDVILGLSILHLLENRDAVIEKVYRVLKPGGVFVTSTMCLGDSLKFIKWIAPLGKLLGFMPQIKVFTARELLDSFIAGGFTIEQQWQPAENAALFVVAKKGV